MDEHKQKVAIFDVDGTIFRSSLFIELVEELINRGIFPQAAWKEYEKEYVEWLDRRGKYEHYIGSMINVFLKYLKGVHYSDFKYAADHVVEQQKNRIYRYPRDLIKKLKDDDYFLLAISHSPKAILEDFCKMLGFDKVYGKIYEIGAENRFTGEIANPHLIENKANIVHRAVEKENLTLKKSIGVGDTESDIPMLEMVDKSICFNPNATLYRMARIRKWKIVVERKDVVYKL